MSTFGIIKDKAEPQNNKEMTDVESEAATRRYPEHVRKRPNKLGDYVNFANKVPHCLLVKLMMTLA